LTNNGGLSPMGEMLYKYLKQQPNPEEEVQAMQQSFDKIRQSGPPTKTKRDAMQKAVDNYTAKFGALDEAMKKDGVGENEDTFRVGTLREAMLTGAAVI